MKINLFAFLLLVLAATSLNAQGFSGGFKAGLNFNTIDGPAEMDEAGNVLETFNNSVGFHVGATFAYAITDLFGFKADLMYSQKGVERGFDGPSYFYLYDDISETLIGGQRRSEETYTNSYLDIPIMAYYRLGPIEVAGGASIGYMVSSVSSGGATYENTVYGDNVSIIFNYEGNYYRDEAGRASIVQRSTETVPGTNVQLPSIIGAYYNSNSDENLFRRLDFGLVADLNVFLNSGLYVGVRYNLGLSDVTRAENDLEQQRRATNPGRQFRDDNDQNQSIQASIGFRF